MIQMWIIVEIGAVDYFCNKIEFEHEAYNVQLNCKTLYSLSSNSIIIFQCMSKYELTLLYYVHIWDNITKNTNNPRKVVWLIN